MAVSEVEVVKETQIISSTPLERKASRAIRIAKRRDYLRRQELESEDDNFTEDEIITVVDRQVAECAGLLEHLLADGDEKVTNIRIASDAREVTRRFEEAKKKRELVAKLEAEANLAQEKFEEISSHWNNILTLNDPLDIENEINIQKKKCDDLITQKNTIIDELKREQKIADETFYKDLKKQLNDIKQLGDRIDSQIILMKNAYQSQLSLIEQSIEMEQALTIRNNQERWNVLYNRRNRSESDNTEKKVALITDFSKKVDMLRNEYQKKHNVTKMKLETDVQALQNELQDLKASCLINTEKIDYNYQILKRREEENILIRSQQKRRLNRMQDVINELKSKISILNGSESSEKHKSNKEVQRLQNSISELQNKAKHFANMNEKKYQQVWKMNQDKAVNLINTINMVDKSIHEQILDIEWVPFDKDPIQGKALITFKKIQKSEKSANEDSSDNDFDMCDEDNKNLIKRIFDILTDSSGFLIEERLWYLLEKYEDVPTKLCKLDNILNALGINEERNVKELLKYFLKYAYCNECKGREKPDDDKEEFREKLDKPHADAKMRCNCGHSFDIEPSNALSAIQDFALSTKTKKSSKTSSIDAEMSSRRLSEKEVATYWSKYKHVYSVQKEKLWDNILEGLNKYLPILQDRHKLHKEVLYLRKQNAELKNLLRGQNTKSEQFKQKYLIPLQKQFIN